MSSDTKKRVICHTIGTAMMATGLALMAYSVYEAIDNEKQQRDRFQQMESNIERQNSVGN
ncbi:MAG TPA: hypothetical protein DD990_15340 [Cyanobacteria bacterium UBA11368]|nr:hypothetical protein [Cyanobacteria bacterium UBA11368]